jgi:uncharacterized membrane protein (DUF2068 family)
MSISVTCPACQAKLKAPDTAAGKKTKCPKCQTVVHVPAASAEPTPAGGNPAAAGGKTAAKKQADQWYLQTPDGNQYGPVGRLELDQWFSEGRVSADCQVLRQGLMEWQWAGEVFPSLGSPAHHSGGNGAGHDANTPLGPQPAASGLTPLDGASLHPASSPHSSAGSGSLSPLGSGGADPLARASFASLPSLGSGMQPLGGTSPLAPSPWAPAKSPNPFAARALGGNYGNYGGASSGLHPMVVVAGIFHIVFGTWNIICCIIVVIGAVALLFVGGAAAAVGANAEEVEAQGAAGALAALGAFGAVILLIVAVLVLAYGIVQICTGVGLFRRRQWARVASFVFAGFGLITLFFSLLELLSLNPFAIITLVAELVYVPIVITAMCMPDAVRDFR